MYRFIKKILKNSAINLKLYNNQKSKFIADSFSLSYGIFIAQIIGLISMPIITRLYSPEDFGRFAFIMALVGIFGFVGTFRLEAIIPSVPHKNDALIIVQMIIILSIILTIVSTILIITLTNNFLHFKYIRTNVSASLFAMPIIICIHSINAALRAYFIREARFISISKGQAIRALSASVLWIIFGLINLGEWGMIFGQLVCDLAFSAQLFTSLNLMEFHILSSPNYNNSKIILDNNKHMIKSLVASATVAAIYSRLPMMTIGPVYGQMYAGYYGLAEKIVSAPLVLLANTIGEVYRNRAAMFYRSGKSFNDLLKKVFLLLVAISFLPFALALWISTNYIGNLLGQEWVGASFTITCLIVAGFFSFNSTPLDKGAIIVGARKYILQINLIRMTVDSFFSMLAFMGIINFNHYLILITVGRCIVYLIDLWVNYNLSYRQSMINPD
jgi:O-antigen/teichoic acid export membrane protein